MELRKEYEEIRSRAIQGLCVPANQVTVGTVIDAVREAVTACQELADRPPRELTDADIHKVVALHGYVAADGGMLHKMLKAIEAAAHAKQREPQVVKFRAARWIVDGSPDMVRCDALAVLPVDMEWLEPAQEFEVKV